MWLFTKFGFFSVVRIKDMNGAVFVRARVRDDLVKFKQYLGRPDACSIRVDRRADYPYRIIVRQSVFAKIAFTIASEIDYHNFKNKVADEQGKERAWLYSKVWQTMSNAEADLEEMKQDLPTVG